MHKNQQVLFLKDISVYLIFRPYIVIFYKTSVKENTNYSSITYVIGDRNQEQILDFFFKNHHEFSRFSVSVSFKEVFIFYIKLDCK